MLADDLQKDASRTVHAQSQAPLFGLPLEIRTEIWTFVLAACEDNVGQSKRVVREQRISDRVQNTASWPSDDFGYESDFADNASADLKFGSYFDQFMYRQTALLLTCRQIYLETFLLNFKVNGHEIWSHRIDQYASEKESLLRQGQVGTNDTYLDWCISRLEPKQLAAISTLHFYLDRSLLSSQDLAAPMLPFEKDFKPKTLHISILLTGEVEAGAVSGDWCYKFDDPFGRMEIDQEVEDASDELDHSWITCTNKLQLYSSIEEVVLEIETPYVEELQIAEKVRRSRRGIFPSPDGRPMRRDESKTKVSKSRWTKLFYKYMGNAGLVFDKKAGRVGADLMMDRNFAWLTADNMPDRYIVTMHFKPKPEERPLSAEQVEDFERGRERMVRESKWDREIDFEKMMEQRRVYEEVRAMTDEERTVLASDTRALSDEEKLALTEMGVVVPESYWDWDEWDTEMVL